MSTEWLAASRRAVHRTPETPTMIRAPASIRRLASTLVVGGLISGFLAPGLLAQSTTVANRGAAPAPLTDTSTTWAFDESSTGNDIFWTSPTAVDPSAPGFGVVFTLTTVDVTVSFLGLPFGPFDALEQLPPDQRTNRAVIPGPAPITFLNSAVTAPPPPDPIALGATLFVGMDGTGSGEVSATNVTFGTVDVDLGFPLGTVTADITGIRIAGTVTVTPLRWIVLPL